MHYIYHAVPEKMIGNNLIPLNSMQDIDDSLRNSYMSKYRGREDILERKIPILDCLWNDVVQLLPIHPQKIFELQKRLGFLQVVPNYRFYKINLSLLDRKHAVVFFKSSPGEDNIVVKLLGDVDFDAIQQIPRATVDYYKSVRKTNELPFNYQFVPHILYKGEVNISSAEIITLS
jgi:hypothetical protein